MKNQQRNWIIAAVIVILALVGGYFVLTNLGNNKTPSTPTSQEQVKGVQVEVTIDYSGEQGKSLETRTVNVTEGKTAWDALVVDVGKENIDYKDYGSLGVLVLGINGVKPTGNNSWEFQVNGKAAPVGVSSYKVKSSDKIGFVITQASKGQ